MSATEQSLLRSVLENPADDAPRLVYADWLEERGDPRGEFIRVQCELAGLDPYSPRRTQLQSRELQLVRQHSKGWAGPLRRCLKRWWFRRGLMEGVRMPAARFLERSRELRATFPLRAAWLTEAWDQLENLSTRGELSRLNELGLPRCVGSGGTWPLRHFLESSRLDNLESLALTDCNLRDAGAQLIAGLPALARLRSLDLHTNGLGPAEIEHLAGSPHLKNVRRLRLGSCFNNRPNYDEDLAGPLPRALSPMLEQLESLELTRCCITRAGLCELTSASPRPALRHLVLDGNQLYDVQWADDYPSLGHVLELPLFQRLITLDLSSCYFGDEGLGFFVSREHAGRIVCLSLNNTEVGPTGADAIARSVNLQNLTQLSLNGGSSSFSDAPAYIRNRGLTALAKSEQLPRLAALSLRRSFITAAGIRSLLASPILQQLYRVDLSFNRIGDEGASLLAAHGPWPKLAYLNVRHNGLGRPARDSLRKSFGYRILV